MKRKGTRIFALLLAAVLLLGGLREWLAAGGLGAPLVPYTEYLLYREEDRTVALENIGGIGNITVLPAGGALADTLAFDTGPGNMVIDALAARVTNGALRYDDGGKLARQGQVSAELLRYLVDSDDYLRLGGV